MSIEFVLQDEKSSGDSLNNSVKVLKHYGTVHLNMVEMVNFVMHILPQ